MVTELRSIFIFISSTLTSILLGTYLRILPYVLVSGLEREYGSARARPLSHRSFVLLHLEHW